MLERRRFFLLGGSVAAAVVAAPMIARGAGSDGRRPVVGEAPAAGVPGSPAVPVRGAARRAPWKPLTGSAFGLTKFLDALRVPPTLRGAAVDVRAFRTQVLLHSQLPPTTVWAYNGSFPGPTIEANSGEEMRIRWSNDIGGTLPFVAVQTPLGPPETPPDRLSQNNPGYPRRPGGAPADGARIYEGVGELPAWLVTHLHGAETGAANDGWAHNGVLRGDSQLSCYPNRQPSATLWYHDHAMGITRWNVFAGLAGMYLIRDDEERALGLPNGAQEIPLVITERNLDIDARGKLTGKMLYKTDFIDESVTPFFGPFTLVNGVIWPHLDVACRWYRFRVLNAANARYYQLNLVDEEGVNHNDAVRQIGTDSGLLPTSAALPVDGLELMPGERADLLIDFGRPELRGKKVRLISTYWNAAIEPDVMQFRVADGRRKDTFTLPERLSRSYTRVRRGSTLPAEHDQVWIGLMPPGTQGQPHSPMWELAEITGAPDQPARFPTAGILQIDDPDTGKVRTFKRVATLFDDTVGIFINRGRWATWNFINFGEPAHPMHVHAVRFQIISRRQFTPNFDLAIGGTTAPQSGWTEAPLHEHEVGWKDMVNANAGEWVTVAGKFGDVTGEFMYHCHVLEHEDEGMMRPFVVHPPEVARFHPGRGGHQGGHGM